MKREEEWSANGLSSRNLWTRKTFERPGEREKKEKVGKVALGYTSFARGRDARSRTELKGTRVITEYVSALPHYAIEFHCIYFVGP